jgi:hypothetical protein
VKIALINNNVVENVIEGESVKFIQGLFPELIAMDGENAAIGMIVVNGVITQPEPEPKPWVINDYVVAVQKALDDWAKTRNYDGILSLCSYATSTIEKFRTEGQRGVAVRDMSWASAYQYLADVNSGKRPLIAPDDLVAELAPLFVWP